MTHQHPILLFDGVCNLCNASIQWVIEHDPQAQFRFASLQSDFAKELLAGYDLPPAALDTVILVENGKAYTRSDAALRVARKVGGLWSLLSAFLIVPRPLRDLVYNFIARNRYRWFGKQESCWLPTPDLRSRFLGS